LDTSEESRGAEHRRRVGCKRGQTTSQVSLRELFRISLGEALAPTDPNAARYCRQNLAVGIFSRPPRSARRFERSSALVARLPPVRVFCFAFRAEHLPIPLYALNSSSRASASFRSAVSKPSVNQL